MQKQKKQCIILVVILLLAVGGYFLATYLGEKETAESVSETQSYELTAFDTETVNKLTFTNESGTFSFQKDGEDWASDEDATLDIEETTIDSMVAILTALHSENQIKNVEDLTEFGLDVPTRTLQLSDGSQTVMILVGEENAAISQYYICLESDQNTVYTMPSSSVTTFDKTLEDCIAESVETEEAEENVASEEATETE